MAAPWEVPTEAILAVDFGRAGGIGGNAEKGFTVVDVATESEGGVVGYEGDRAVEDSQTVYPYAVTTAALLPAGSIASGRRGLLISIVTMAFIFGFLAGIAAGDSLNDIDQFSNSVRYGVAREEGT